LHNSRPRDWKLVGWFWLLLAAKVRERKGRLSIIKQGQLGAQETYEAKVDAYATLWA